MGASSGSAQGLHPVLCSGVILLGRVLGCGNQHASKAPTWYIIPPARVFNIFMSF